MADIPDLLIDENYNLADLVDEMAVRGEALVIKRIPRNRCDVEAVPGTGPCYQVSGLSWDDDGVMTWAAVEVNENDLQLALQAFALEVLTVEEE